MPQDHNVSARQLSEFIKRGECSISEAVSFLRNNFRNSKSIQTNELFDLGERIVSFVSDNSKLKLSDSELLKGTVSVSSFLSNFIELQKKQYSVTRAFFYVENGKEPRQIKSNDELALVQDKESIYVVENIMNRASGDKTRKYYRLVPGDDGYYPQSISKEQWDRLTTQHTDRRKTITPDKPNTSDIVDDDILSQRTYLIVSNKDKNTVKKLGAKVDPKNNYLFYVPRGIDIKPFSRWTTQVQEPIIRDAMQRSSNSGTRGGDPEDDFKEIIRSLGLDDNIDLQYTEHTMFRSARVNTLREAGGKRSKTPGSYKFSIDPSGFHYGWVKNNKTGEIINYDQRKRVDLSSVPKELYSLDKQLIRVKMIEAEILEKKLIQEAIIRCNDEYKKGHPVKSSKEHEYLIAKKIDPSAAIRRHNKTLLIPLYNIKGEMTSLQKIGKIPDKETGEWVMSKRILPGSFKIGTMSIVDKTMTHIKDIESMSVVLLAEGYSTAASISMALDAPVIMTVDAGNMKSVARELKKYYPDKDIVVMADNDEKNVLKKEEDPSLPAHECRNIGIESANYIREKYKIPYIAPVFTEKEYKMGLSDMNDIHCEKGLDTLRHFLVSELKKIGISMKETKQKKISAGRDRQRPPVGKSGKLG